MHHKVIPVSLAAYGDMAKVTRHFINGLAASAPLLGDISRYAFITSLRRGFATALQNGIAAALTHWAERAHRQGFSFAVPPNSPNRGTVPGGFRPIGFVT